MITFVCIFVHQAWEFWLSEIFPILGMVLNVSGGYCFLQIISANVSTTNHQPVPLDDVELPFEVQFSYSVTWSSTKWVYPFTFYCTKEQINFLSVCQHWSDWLSWVTLFYCSKPYSERLKSKGAGSFFPKSLEVRETYHVSYWVLPYGIL